VVTQSGGFHKDPVDQGEPGVEIASHSSYSLSDNVLAQEHLPFVYPPRIGPVGIGNVRKQDTIDHNM
jgi:hypothetical protein